MHLKENFISITKSIWIWKNVQIADVFRFIGSALIGLSFSRLSSHWSFVFQALLSLVYLTSSDIFALINYTGFATWVSSTNRLAGLGALVTVVLTRLWCSHGFGAQRSEVLACFEYGTEFWRFFMCYYLWILIVCSVLDPNKRDSGPDCFANSDPILPKRRNIKKLFISR